MPAIRGRHPRKRREDGRRGRDRNATRRGSPRQCRLGPHRQADTLTAPIARGRLRMRLRPTLRTSLVIILAAVALPAALAQTSEAPRPQVDRDAGLAEWERVYEVFAHPRCANCHVEDERPRWSGPHYGATRIHAFNVQRGE